MKKVILSFVILFATGLISSHAQDTWVQKSDLGCDAPNVPQPSARIGAVGFSIGSKGYLGTGYSISSPYYTKDFWEYDPDSNAWTQKADVGGTDRYWAVGFSIVSKWYVGTGSIGSSPYYPKDF